jgi:hypothetical protein
MSPVMPPCITGIAGQAMPKRAGKPWRPACRFSTTWRGLAKMRRGSPLTGLHGKSIITKKEWASRSKIAMMAMQGRTPPAREGGDPSSKTFYNTPERCR